MNKISPYEQYYFDGPNELFAYLYSFLPIVVMKYWT